MAVLLWDDVHSVGCGKTCCPTGELIICDFLPVIVEPNGLDYFHHLKPNKYLNK